MIHPRIAIVVVAAAIVGQLPATVEQTTPGARAGLELVESFDGLGAGFDGPQGAPTVRNASDNSLAVGPDHIMQTVNSRMAIFTKKGKKFDTTGKVLVGAVPNNTVFAGFTGACQSTNNGDTVVRYDQLADRWLIVMPIFRRIGERPDAPPEWKGDGTVYAAPPGVQGQPGPAVMFTPPTPTPTPSPSASPSPTPTPSTSPTPVASPTGSPTASPAPARGRGPAGPAPVGPYAVCYAISATSDPLGPYYRYEFLRPLFPDYPRPAVWSDGYYIPTSTGDEVIQKHVCVVDRARMLKGEPATEQCVIVDGVNFLNTSDLDGKRPPPAGAPNIIVAAGGTQLKKTFNDDAIFVWQLKVDWSDPAKTKLAGPQRIAVAPYHYLCNGQLTDCVPQPGTERKLDAQGDKIMARFVYRNLGSRESLVAVHSVDTAAGGGGVRWYELQVAGKDRAVTLRQQGTYAPDGFYRWMGSPAIDKQGNIGIGYSFGGTPNYAGQRFAGRLVNDPLGVLSLKEVVLAEGGAAQTYTNRWEDYAQTGVDPADDCRIWYVGDYYKAGATNYSTKIGAFRLGGCK